MKPAILWGGRLCDNAKTLRASAVVPPTLKLITAFKKKRVSGASGRRGVAVRAAGVRRSVECTPFCKRRTRLLEQKFKFKYQVGFSHTENFDL